MFRSATSFLVYHLQQIYTDHWKCMLTSGGLLSNIFPNQLGNYFCSGFSINILIWEHLHKPVPHQFNSCWTISLVYHVIWTSCSSNSVALPSKTSRLILNLFVPVSVHDSVAPSKICLWTFLEPHDVIVEALYHLSVYFSIISLYSCTFHILCHSQGWSPNVVFCHLANNRPR